MKYKITFNGNNGNEDSVIVEAGRAEVHNGCLHLVTGQNATEHIHAIFSNWLRIVEVQE